MPHFLCATCGTQYAESAAQPERCPICEDERQFVPPGGQQWTTMVGLREKYTNEFQEMEPGLTAIWTRPQFAIGQRAFLMETPGGNFLWDCVSLLDERTEQFIRSRGNLAGIAISHPHYYTTMVEWARCFQVPVLLHENDRQWVMRPDDRLRFWSGQEMLLPDLGLILIRAGGHFAGGTVLYCPSGAGGGALLTGDILQVNADRKSVSIMYSYPNWLPLGPKAVLRVASAVEHLDFDRIYGAFPSREIVCDGRAVLQRSVARILDLLSD